MMKSFLKTFSSLKLAVGLISLIALAAVIGTLIPQLRTPEFYATRYGALSTWMIRLGFTHLYRSGWFVLLLILFSLNTLTCTLTRLGPKAKSVLNPKVDKPENELLALRLHETFSSPLPAAACRDRILAALKLHHYRLREKTSGSDYYFLGRKKSAGRFGSDFVHFGLLFILGAGILSSLGGIRRNLLLHPGETASLPKAGFEVRLDKFETEYYPDRTVKDWKSTLTILEDRQPILTRTIEVNHPLPFQGYRFYQASYGTDWEKPILLLTVKSPSRPGIQYEIQVRNGATETLVEENLEITARHFAPDFALTADNKVISRSSDPNNPAAYLEVSRNNQNIFAGWIFARHPDFPQSHEKAPAEFVFELTDVHAAQYSVIQAARDPGALLIWIGSGLVMFGLGLAFYWRPREIRLILQENASETLVVGGGLGSGNREALAREFSEILSSLRTPQ